MAIALDTVCVWCGIARKLLADPPAERARNPHRIDERQYGRACLRRSYPIPFDPVSPQIAINAGHEFIISTDPKYSEICDDKVLWVDYVRSLTEAGQLFFSGSETLYAA